MSSTVSSEQLISALNWRYATKAFDPSKKIPADLWKTLEEALRLSPSSFGLQPWKFFVVTDPATREKLKAASWGQSQITDASHLVVLARKADVNTADVEKFITTTASTNGIPASALDGYKGMMNGFISNPGLDKANWATKQVYIALGFLLESAALLGIDACPMEGIDPKAYDELLGLPDKGYHALVVTTLGYRSPNDKYAHGKKVRYPASEIIEHL